MVVQLIGCEAQAAYDGPTALTMAQTLRSHVVQLDVGLLGMDGYEVARQRRTKLVTKGVILTAMTGWGQDHPLFMLAPQLTEAGQAQPAEPAALRVLVVDDNVDAADSLAMLVELAGHEVQVAYDGPLALTIAQSFRPHVVLLDLNLPAMDGYEVARQLRQRPETQETVLAAVTAWGQPEDRRQSKEAGFDRHFVKPVDPTVITKLLSDAKAGGGRLPPGGRLGEGAR